MFDSSNPLSSEKILAVEKHKRNFQEGLEVLPWMNLKFSALGRSGWTRDLILSTWEQATTGLPPRSGREYRIGKGGDGFDALSFRDLQLPSLKELRTESLDLSLDLNKRTYGQEIRIDLPWYGAGMSYGSVSLRFMLSRARAAKELNTFTCTGEGGYPAELIQYKDHIITQASTGYFGVREETLQASRINEFKYAQGAKPGLGGHLLSYKVTEDVANMRESVAGVDIYQPFPFHSVYSVEDHKKHVDWLKSVNPDALVSVKVSTPIDIDMVAIGIYHAGAHIIHLDGGYGGTGAAPNFAKKNIAMPIEFAIPRVHKYLVEEGVREEIVLMASGRVRSAYDIAELIAVGCTLCGNCEKGASGRGCQSGIATTDREFSRMLDVEWGTRRIVNLERAWAIELKRILQGLGLNKIRELRGRTDLLLDHGGVYEQ
ncbi:MAG: FMN-binding glutamate synthase family protein [Thermoplasmata archaeon]